MLAIIQRSQHFKKLLLFSFEFPLMFFSKPSILYEEAIGSLYLINTVSAEASSLANFRRVSCKLGHIHESKETISIPVASYISHQSGAPFYGPGNGGPCGSHRRDLGDPVTHCTHLVSLSARRCFPHRVEIWGVYYSTSWRFPPSTNPSSVETSLPLILF